MAFGGGSGDARGPLPPWLRLDVPLQMRMQGFVDTVGWGASALGTVGSGVLFAIGDYRHAALGVVRPEAALEAEAMARL